MITSSRPGRHGTARLVAALLLAVHPVTFAVAGGAGQTTDWRSLRSRPRDFVGRTVTLGPAYCGTGGQEGKEPGLYQCAIGPGTVYVESRTVALSRAARARMAGCGGLDVWERSGFCRSTVAFVVGRYRSAPDIDAKADVLLFSADRLVIE